MLECYKVPDGVLTIGMRVHFDERARNDRWNGRYATTHQGRFELILAMVTFYEQGTILA